MNLLSDPDFRAVMNTIVTEIFAAMPNVVNDAQDTLKRHIDKDVYSAYTPTVYKRRSDNESYGTPLNNMLMYTKEISPVGGNVGGKLVVTSRLYYNPTGVHTVKKWSSSGSSKKGILNVDGNDLINRIEKKSPGYNWGNDIVPARPFWQEFVTEMVQGGEFEKAFVSEMRKTEQIVADGNVIEDPSDRQV